MMFQEARTADPSAGALMLAEMSEQPDLVAGTLRRAAERAGDLARAVEGAEAVLFVGRGSSRAAGMYGAAATRRFTGKPAYLVSPTELGWVERGQSPRANRLVVAISQSGESQEVLAAVEREVAAGNRVVVVTNAPHSSLATMANASSNAIVLDCLAGQERAVPATKSVTTTLACLFTLASAARPAHLDAAAAELPGLMQRVLTDSIDELDLSGCHGFATVGEGFAEAVAEEGAIKLRETLRLPVSAHEASEFLHGNVNAVGSGMAVICVAADGLGLDLAGTGIVESNRRGARTCLIAPGVEPSTGVVPLPEAPPEWVPFLAVLPIQRAAHAASLAAGFNPDVPVGLSKVTRVFGLQAAQG
jgi:glucosamine--fructose-6-phosphate aminotransferase (isomerizing)